MKNGMTGFCETIWTKLHKHSYHMFSLIHGIQGGCRKRDENKKENIRDVEEGWGIKDRVNIMRVKQMFMWKCHNDTLTLYF